MGDTLEVTRKDTEENQHYLVFTHSPRVNTRESTAELMTRRCQGTAVAQAEELGARRPGAGLGTATQQKWSSGVSGEGRQAKSSQGLAGGLAEVCVGPPLRIPKAARPAVSVHIRSGCDLYLLEKPRL